MSSWNRKQFLQGIGSGVLGSLFLPNTVLAKTERNPLISQSNPSKTRVLRVAHLTDIHVENNQKSIKGFELALQSVNNLAQPVDFIINGGDSIMNAVALSKKKVAEQWKLFHSILKHNNNIPIHHTIGNHDLFGWALPGSDKTDGKKWATEEYGLNECFYSFEIKDWKFIILDSIHPRNTFPGYFGNIDSEQMHWLLKELHTNKSNHICIVSHIPILSVRSMFDNNHHSKNNWFIPDNTLHADAKILREHFYNNQKVRACLSGHIHLIDHVNYLGTDYYCNGAVSGNWWNGSYQEFPPAFVVMNFYSDGSSDREIHYYQWK